MNLDLLLVLSTVKYLLPVLKIRRASYKSKESLLILLIDDLVWLSVVDELKLMSDDGIFYLFDEIFYLFDEILCLF